MGERIKPKKVVRIFIDIKEEKYPGVTPDGKLVSWLGYDMRDKPRGYDKLKDLFL